MSSDLVLSDLQAMFQVQAALPDFHGEIRLTEDDVQRWIACGGSSRSALYDEIAVRLARGFSSSDLTFEFCDAVMNGIYSFILHADQEWPELFWRIFHAFDEGEYYHHNNREEDPVAVYTRPMISHILDELSSR